MAPNKPAEKLRSIALVLMLLIPFLMYAAAQFGGSVWVIISLFLMAANMVVVMKTG